MNKKIPQSILKTSKMSTLSLAIFVMAILIGAFSVTPSAHAAVTFDPTSGTGFVGKGDVQTVLGLNNAQLQAAATASPSQIQFSVQKQTVEESSWTCDRDAGPQTQERARTTTTETSIVTSSTARSGPNQITGFNLVGYSGSPTIISETHEGQAFGSCPTGWTAINVVGPTVVSETGALYVNGKLLYSF